MEFVTSRLPRNTNQPYSDFELRWHFESSVHSSWEGSQKRPAGLSQIRVVIGHSYISRDESAMKRFDSTFPADGKGASSKRNIEREHAVFIKLSNDQNVPAVDAYYEAIASQEETYIEETEEELREIFTSDDPSPHKCNS